MFKRLGPALDPQNPGPKPSDSYVLTDDDATDPGGKVVSLVPRNFVANGARTAGS